MRYDIDIYIITSSVAMQCSSNNVRHTLYFDQYIILGSLHCTPYIVRRTVYVQRSLYGVQYSVSLTAVRMYISVCTPYNVRRTVYVQLTSYIVFGN